MQTPISDAPGISRSASSRRAAWLVGALLIGAIVAHAMMPYLFYAIPLGTMRIEMIISSLARTDVKPEVAVFGNSVTASSIDFATLSRNLPGEPTVFVLASPLQGIGEAYLTYQDLPDSVSLVIQQMTPWEFVERGPFGRNKFNTYYLYGYRPEPHTIEVLEEIFGADTGELMRASTAAHLFRARWIVRRLLDASFWLNLPVLMGLDDLGREVFFYPDNNRRLSDDHLQLLIRAWASLLGKPDRVAFERKRQLLRVALTELRASGRKAVIYVPPIHPDLRPMLPPQVWEWFEEILAEARAAGASAIVDLRATQPDPGFRDAVHLMGRVGKTVTAALAKEVVSAGAWEPRSATLGTGDGPTP